MLSTVVGIPFAHDSASTEILLKIFSLFATKMKVAKISTPKFDMLAIWMLVSFFQKLRLANAKQNRRICQCHIGGKSRKHLKNKLTRSVFLKCALRTDKVGAS